MKVKDILNKEHVNLQNCDQEPIHIPGSIQPHGFLLAIDKDSLRIKFCSENSIHFVKVSPAQLLDKKVSELFNTTDTEQIIRLCNSSSTRVTLLEASLLAQSYKFIVHLRGQYLLLEAEEQNSFSQPSDLVELSGDFVISMEETQTLKELCDLVTVSIKKITGYDRVMVYRFDEKYNGEVFSESKNEELESFLGLHYPHTDIPVQARELYIKNQLRIIVDIGYQPVPLYTIDDGNNATLDLSLSVLRSVSPIHIQYLQNMGVGATLTISLLLRGKLWGLIACHHYSAKYLPYDIRMSAKLLGHFITSQIDSRLLNEEYEIQNKANMAVEAIASKKIELNWNSFQEIVDDLSILSVCNANGVSILLKGSVYSRGITFSGEEVKRLAEYLKKFPVFHTESLGLFNDLPSLSSAIPGVNYFELSKNTGNCIIWFRQESIHEVHWAGDPSKSIEKDKNGLSPRKSFELWSETVKNQSKPWLKSELNASASFVNLLEKHLSAVYLAEEEESQRMLVTTLAQANAELENINFISTHDIQEPLRKIQMMASLLLVQEGELLSKESFEKISKMNRFAGSIQLLIKDILKYSRLNFDIAVQEEIKLEGIIEVVKSESAEFLTAKKGELHYKNLPRITGVSILVKQLFANLVNNAIKFSDPSRPVAITISEVADPGSVPVQMKKPLSFYTIIEFTDNGIGFDSSYNESVFKIFSRLHSKDEISGSGIGLALCNKIMSKHNGYITATGCPGVGATFTLFFPK